MVTQKLRTFGKYRLVRRLAMGGMAEIFQAQLVGAAGFVRDVVIKRIHPEFSDDDEFVQMFIHEARVAAKLHHPNIVQVLDFDRVDDTYYIAMELVDGLDLKQLRLRAQRTKQPLPVPLAVLIAVEALKGLAYAHELQHQGNTLHIVHRDISPQNILVSRQGQVKVADFGIARVMQYTSGTAKGVLKGKLAYMAPEQTRSSHVDPRADLFSMGVVLWEMLCGERLFRANNDLQLIEMVRSHPIPPPHMRNPDVDEALSELVMRALDRNLETRIPNAATMARELRQWCLAAQLEEELRELICRLCRTDDADKTLPLQSQDIVDSGEVAKAARHTAQLKGWSPPGASESPPVPAVPAAVMPASPDTREDAPGLAPETSQSWTSFPTEDAAPEQDASAPDDGEVSQAGVNDWMVKTDQIDPAALLGELQASLNESAVEVVQEQEEVEEDLDIDVDATVQFNPAHILEAINTDRDPAVVEPDILSTIQIDPQVYLHELHDALSPRPTSLDAGDTSLPEQSEPSLPASSGLQKVRHDALSSLPPGQTVQHHDAVGAAIALRPATFPVWSWMGALLMLCLVILWYILTHP